jgi:altronate dehydratase small subunit
MDDSRLRHSKALLIDYKDNVAVALTSIPKGNSLVLLSDDGPVVEMDAKEDIPLGHKIATGDIPMGKYVVKYGQIIGVATRDIRVGHHVHVHNVESLRGKE